MEALDEELVALKSENVRLKQELQSAREQAKDAAAELTKRQAELEHREFEVCQLARGLQSAMLLCKAYVSCWTSRVSSKEKICAPGLAPSSCCSLDIATKGRSRSARRS